MCWLCSYWKELFNSCFNMWKAVRYAFCPVLCISLSVPGALQESVAVEFPPGTYSRPLEQVLQNQREHLHCMDQTTTCCNTPFIQRSSIVFRVCAGSCCIIYQNQGCRTSNRSSASQKKKKKIKKLKERRHRNMKVGGSREWCLEKYQLSFPVGSYVPSTLQFSGVQLVVDFLSLFCLIFLSQWCDMGLAA